MEKGENQLPELQPGLKCLGCPSVWYLNGNGRVSFGLHECGGKLIKTTLLLPKRSIKDERGNDRTIQSGF